MKNKPSGQSLIKTILIVCFFIFVIWFLSSTNKKVEPATFNFQKTNVEKVVSISKTVQPTQTQITETKAGEYAVNILMYHHIGPLPKDADDIRKGLTVSQESFEDQIKHLKDNNYKVITARTLLENIKSNSVPEKAVVLTFDDGYEDNYLYAAPILNKYSFNGTFNIITAKVGETEYMSESQLRELVQQKHELASHSANHPSLDKLTGEKLNSELKNSKEYLDKLTGQNTVTFCYPAGKFSDEVKADLNKLGYQVALTTQASKGKIDTRNIFETPRLRVNPTTKISTLLY